MTTPLAITRSDAHEYTVDGLPYPGVTSVIGTVIRKPGLERWIGKVGNAEAERIRKEAAAHGTLVHALAALVVQGVPSIALEDEGPTQEQIAAFTDWFAAYVSEVHAVELKVAHPTFRYAGTLDLLVRLIGDKRPTIVDIKTGSALYPEMRLQTAAYREAALPLISDFCYQRRDCRRGCLHIPREVTGPAQFHEHTKHVADFGAFVSALNIYHWLRSA